MEKVEEKSAIDLTPIVVEDKGWYLEKLLVIWKGCQTRSRDLICPCFVFHTHIDTYNKMKNAVCLHIVSGNFFGINVLYGKATVLGCLVELTLFSCISCRREERGR